MEIDENKLEELNEASKAIIERIQLLAKEKAKLEEAIRV